MADVNKTDASNIESLDHIGDIILDGFRLRKITHLSRSSDLNLFGYIYQQELFNFTTVIKRNPHVGLETSVWKRLISLVSAEATLHCVPSSNIDLNPPLRTELKDPRIYKPQIVEGTVKNKKIECPIHKTYSSACRSNNGVDESSGKPYFRDDHTYVIPMSVCFEDVTSDVRIVELRIFVCLYTYHSVQNVESSPEGEPNNSTLTAGHKAPASSHRLTKIKVDHSAFFDDDSEDDGDDQSTKKEEQVKSPLRDDTQSDVHSKHQSETRDIPTDTGSLMEASRGSSHVQEKTVVKKLKIQEAPTLAFQYLMAGDRHLVQLSVNNQSDEEMIIHDINLSLLDSDHKGHNLLTQESLINENVFPVSVIALEELHIIYRLDEAAAMLDSDLSLRATMRWTHTTAVDEIFTVYRLPKLRIRSPPFIVNIKCEEEVEAGKTFYTTYTISNDLHDFIKMRLYDNIDNLWRSLMEKEGEEEERRRVNLLRNVIVCHDPDTDISSCPKGSCVPIQVGFQIHRPGVYEMSELMKVNLQYSLPENTQHRNKKHNTQRQTPTLPLPLPTSPPSLKALGDRAVEELWKREGSAPPPTPPAVNQRMAMPFMPANQRVATPPPASQTTVLSPPSVSKRTMTPPPSLASPKITTPPSVSQLAVSDKRHGFGAKSYSFSDLDSTFSSATVKPVHNKYLQRSLTNTSTSRPSSPARSPPQTERDLLLPSNFLKQPYYIYVRDPLAM